jgi:hypothetical protein
VREEIAAGFEVVVGHRCGFLGREVAHSR